MIAAPSRRASFLSVRSGNAAEMPVWRAASFLLGLGVVVVGVTEVLDFVGHLGVGVQARRQVIVHGRGRDVVVLQIHCLSLEAARPLPFSAPGIGVAEAEVEGTQAVAEAEADGVGVLVGVAHGPHHI